MNFYTIKPSPWEPCHSIIMQNHQAIANFSMDKFMVCKLVNPKPAFSHPCLVQPGTQTGIEAP